jgi:hypothetical protein
MKVCKFSGGSSIQSDAVDYKLDRLERKRIVELHFRKTRIFSLPTLSGLENVSYLNIVNCVLPGARGFFPQEVVRRAFSHFFFVFSEKVAASPEEPEGIGDKKKRSGQRTAQYRRPPTSFVLEFERQWFGLLTFFVGESREATKPPLPRQPKTHSEARGSGSGPAVRYESHAFVWGHLRYLWSGREMSRCRYLFFVLQEDRF